MNINERKNRHILSGRWSPTGLIVSGTIALRRQKQDQKQGQRAGAPALHEQAKKEKANLTSQTGLYLCRQVPTLPRTFACSTIGPAGFSLSA